MSTEQQLKVRIIHASVLIEKDGGELVFRPKLFLSNGDRYVFRSEFTRGVFASRMFALRMAQGELGKEVSELASCWVKWED